MIYTVTFNPAIDYIININKLEKGKINFAEESNILPGGKGINVSTVLTNLEIENIALGFIGGFSGQEIKNRLKKLGVNTDFIEVEKGLTRINIKIKEKNIETAINCNSLIIEDKDIKELLNKLDKLKNDDILVLSGSIPTCVDESIYEKICKSVYRKGTKVVIDARKKLLKNALQYNPFLIKPNRAELEELTDCKIKNFEDIIENAKKMQELGAKNILVSMGEEGAILVSHNGKIYKQKAPTGKLINSVGAGDSMIAGFLAGYIAYDDYEKALKMGVAAGSASAFSSNLATKEETYKLFNRKGGN